MNCRCCKSWLQGSVDEATSDADKAFHLHFRNRPRRQRRTKASVLRLLMLRTAVAVMMTLLCGAEAIGGTTSEDWADLALDDTDKMTTSTRRRASPTTRTRKSAQQKETEKRACQQQPLIRTHQCKLGWQRWRRMRTVRRSGFSYPSIPFDQKVPLKKNSFITEWRAMYHCLDR